MPQDSRAKERVPEVVAARALPGAAQEAEVYGALGSLLGMLEVIATDDVALSAAQLSRLRTALGLGQRLQQYVESLLTLAADDLEPRLRLSVRALRPLVEHALRGALRAFDPHEISLRWPTRADWGSERVRVDVSRFDRSLGALVGVLANNLRRAGSIDIEVEAREGRVLLTLHGEPCSDAGDAEPPASGLIERACQRLLVLHGGELSQVASGLGFVLTLPIAEAP